MKIRGGHRRRSISPIDARGLGFACYRIAINRLNAGNFMVKMLAHPTEPIEHFNTRPYPPVTNLCFPPDNASLSEGASWDLNELDWPQNIDSAYQASFTEAYNQNTIKYLIG